jgi:hypothetical protein
VHERVCEHVRGCSDFDASAFGPNLDDGGEGAVELMGLRTQRGLVWTGGCGRLGVRSR